MRNLLCLCGLLLAVSCAERTDRRFPLPVDESLAAHRTPWDTFSGEQGGWSCVALEFDTPQDWSEWTVFATTRHSGTERLTLRPTKSG